MNNTDIRDLSDSLGPCPRPTPSERATIRSNIFRRFRAEDAELLIEALGVAS